MAAKLSHDDPVLGALTDDQLTGDYRVYQRAKGHRFSSDDVATAFIAYRTCPEAKRVIDLGCGLGSVLLHLAWRMPEATLVGVEAQEMSFELLRRNVDRNGLASRVEIHHGDLRDEALVTSIGAGFDLVTGTPPYFPPDTALDAMDPQRAFARIEYRGGVEAYVASGQRLLSQTGRLVICGDARALDRVEQSAPLHGLSIVAHCDIIAREGRPALFSIWTFSRSASARSTSALTLRRAKGDRTPDADDLREFSGFGRLLKS